MPKNINSIVKMVKPKNKKKLLKIIEETIKNKGPKCDLNFIDTSLITDMSFLFWFSSYSREFQGNISKWDVSNVTDMKSMFEESKFNGDISKWNVSNVKDMSGMFEDSKFNGDISKWNVSKVRGMRYMFMNSKFNGDLSEWNVSKVEDMCGMFDSSKFNGDISKWNVSKVISMDNMFYSSKFNGDISKWNVSKVTFMNGMFAHSKFNGDISKWNVSKVTNMSRMFENSKFNGDISKWDVSKVTDMRFMFLGSNFIGDISKWDVSNVTTMEGMFCCSKFKGDISEWNVSKVTDMYGMFYNSKFNGDISDWDVYNVTTMEGIFCNSNFKRDISKWNVEKVNDTKFMYNSPLFNGDISDWLKGIGKLKESSNEGYDLEDEDFDSDYDELDYILEEAVFSRVDLVLFKQKKIGNISYYQLIENDNNLKKKLINHLKQFNIIYISRDDSEISGVMSFDINNYFEVAYGINNFKRAIFDKVQVFCAEENIAVCASIIAGGYYDEISSYGAIGAFITSDEITCSTAVTGEFDEELIQELMNKEGYSRADAKYELENTEEFYNRIYVNLQADIACDFIENHNHKFLDINNEIGNNELIENINNDGIPDDFIKKIGDDSVLFDKDPWKLLIYEANL